MLERIGINLSLSFIYILLFRHLITPALTTVHVNKQYLGKTAVSRLVQKINTPDYDIQKILIATKTIQRDSVKKR